MNEEEKRAIELVREIKREFERIDEETTNEDKEDTKALGIVLNLVEKLQKENEELTISNKEIDKECSRLEAKEKSRNIEPVLINNKMYFIDKNLYEDLLNDIKSNYIPTQKIKGKIEELEKDEYSKYYYMFLEERDLKYTIQILQELLEEGDNK